MVLGRFKGELVMGFISWMEKKTKNLDVIDIGLTKWGSIFFGALVGAYFADTVLKYWLVFLALVIILAIRPAYKTLKG